MSYKKTQVYAIIKKFRESDDNKEVTGQHTKNEMIAKEEFDCKLREKFDKNPERNMNDLAKEMLRSPQSV